MRLYLYSNGIKHGFFRDGKELQKAYGKGIVRPYKCLVEEEDATLIPKGWHVCQDDRTAIEKIPTMKSFIKALTK